MMLKDIKRSIEITQFTDRGKERTKITVIKDGVARGMICKTTQKG